MWRYCTITQRTPPDCQCLKIVWSSAKKPVLDIIQAYLWTAANRRQCWPVQKTVDTKPVSQVLCKCLYSCHTVGDRRRDKETIEIPQLHCCSFFWLNHIFFRPSCQTPERRPKVVTPWKVLNLRRKNPKNKIHRNTAFHQLLEFLLMFWHCNLHISRKIKRQQGMDMAL